MTDVIDGVTYHLHASMDGDLVDGRPAEDISVTDDDPSEAMSGEPAKAAATGPEAAPVTADQFAMLAEHVLAERARVDVLEVAFLNLLSLSGVETVKAFEAVFRERGEQELLAAEDHDLGQKHRQDLAAVRLGKRIEAILAKSGWA